MSARRGNDPLAKRVRQLLSDEQSVRKRLYGGRRTIDVSPLKAPLNSAAPQVSEPEGPRDQVLVDADLTG